MRRIEVVVSSEDVEIEKLMSEIVKVLSKHGGGTVSHEIKLVAQNLEFQVTDEAAN